MTNEENVTITQTAPDGTETVIEITQTKPDDAPGDDQSIVEEVIEALFDTDDDDDDATVDSDTDADPDGVVEPGDKVDDPDTGLALDSEDTSEAATDDPITADASTPTADDPTIAAAPDAGGVADTTDQADPASATDEGTPANQAHLDAATDAQQQADEFAAQGDYAAAAEAREVAENEAYAGGDDSMLSGSTANELTNAADQQATANQYEQEEAADAQAGNWDAAKEDAGNAAYAQGGADYYGGGSDHTAQAKAEENQMDWAGWEQGNADSHMKDAEEYAAQGDFDHAEHSADLADADQGMADYHGALGEHGGDMAIQDDSSAVASGGSYEAPAEDNSSYDAGSTDFSE